MAEHRFTPDHYHTALGTYPPVLEIAPGDRVTTTTVDAAGQDAAYASVAARPNPMTGPFHIVGAEPGDALLVTIEAMVPTRRTGWTRAVVAPNVVDPQMVASLPPNGKVEWVIDAAAGTVRLDAPPAALDYLTLPFEPMIGCFGVAPTLAQAISTATSAEHGGNMDYRGFGPGSTAWFPVAVPGALFFLGDGHARQGDGEIVGTGIETSFEITFSVSLRKNTGMVWPRGESASHIFTLGNARPLDQALQHATSEMLRWLKADYGLDAGNASHLLGQAVQYEIGNVFDPAYTVVCKLDRRFLPPAKV